MVLFGNGGKNARLLGTALLIVTFVAGALAGAAAIRVVSAEKVPAVRERTTSPMRGGPRRLLLDEQFTKELGLSADQRSRIRTILDRRDAEAKAMWQTFEPRLKAFGQQVRDEIATVLTAEQQQKLDEAVEQRRASWKKQRQSCDSAHTAVKEKQQ